MLVLRAEISRRPAGALGKSSRGRGVSALRALPASPGRAARGRAAAVDRRPAAGRCALGPAGRDGARVASAASDRSAAALAGAAVALTAGASDPGLLMGGVLLHGHDLAPRDADAGGRRAVGSWRLRRD